MTDPFIRAQLSRLDDFWRRREAAPTCELEFPVFGHPVHFAANDHRLLEAARLSAARYSRSQAIQPPIRLRVVVDSQLAGDPVPEDWPARLRCMAVGRWLTVNCDPWVSACADLDSWSAVALVSDSLAQQPDYLSRYICDRFLLNLVMGEGLGRLHASCLRKDRKAILLNGPSASGKSTTALRLALAGYSFLSDAMVHLRTHGGRMELLAYPVGEAKLRDDTLEWFPDPKGHSKMTGASEHTKTVLDLRQVDGVEVVEDSVWPDEVVIAHLVRTGTEMTAARRITPQEMLERVWPEASFVEDESVMSRNLVAIRRLLASARCYLLEVGSDPVSLIAAIEGL